MRQIEPQLAELLRTCIHPPSLFLRIKHIQRVDLKYPYGYNQDASSDRPDFDGIHRYACKLLLSDGELAIQALTHRKLSGLSDIADLNVGDCIDIRQFAVKHSKRIGRNGKVVFLAVEDCTFIKAVKETHELEQTVKQHSSKRQRQEESFSTISDYESAVENLLQVSPSKKLKKIRFEEDSEDKQKQKQADTRITPSKTRKALPASWHLPAAVDEDDEFAFSTQQVDAVLSTKRRQALRELDKNVRVISQIDSEPIKAIDSVEPTIQTQSIIQQDLPMPKTPVAAVSPQTWLPTPLPRTEQKRNTSQGHAHWINPIRPDGAFALSQIPPSAQPFLHHPKLPPQQAQAASQPIPQQPQMYPIPPFHNLRTLRDPPASQPLPTKSYTFSTLAVITWTGTSLIHKRGSAFPPKRHLKVFDPSLVRSTASNHTSQPTSSAPAVATSSFRPENPFQEAITVAIYINAETFKPQAGTIALFRGLVMQRLANGDVILNVYGRLKDMAFQGDDVLGLDREASSERHWFVTDEEKIRKAGYTRQLEEIKAWWEETRRR